LIILGMGQSIYGWISNCWSNFDASSEIWVINSGALCLRHDIVFDMHTDEYIDNLKESIKERVTNRRDWMKTHDRTIVMPKSSPEYPTSITYPLKAVFERSNSLYFSNGIAYMLGMAYCCDVEQLMLFGCDFSYDRDTNTHDEQGRACAEYWVGRLVEKGTKVGFGPDTHFMDSYTRSQGKIYGYHELVTMDFPNSGEGKAKFVSPDYITIPDVELETPPSEDRLGDNTITIDKLSQRSNQEIQM
jgi:hypothetical protein